MSGLLKSWILSMTGAALLCAGALALTPEGRTRSAVRLLCGVVMAVTLLSPLQEMDLSVYSMSLASYRDAAAQSASRLDETNDRLSRTIIETESEAYIWDKARAVGLTPEEVTVTVKWGDALCWYPYEMTLRTAWEPWQRRELSATVEAELGIPEARQHWETPISAQDTKAGGG